VFQCQDNRVSQPAEHPSARREELLELAYRYVLEHGLSELSLRPLAAAIGSSPRVLLYLFGSKEGLIRAVLGVARSREVALLTGSPVDRGAPLDHAAQSDRGTPGAPSDRGTPGAPSGLADAVSTTWAWLADPAHRPLLRVWLEAYARSISEPDGPWAGFAEQTVQDWLALLARAQSPGRRRTLAGQAERTLALAVLRGALLDLLATDDARRSGAAVAAHLASLVVDPARPGTVRPGTAQRRPSGRPATQ
jgi:AcrR family transcriptional regulator